MTPEEIKKTEQIVNEKIREGLSVHTDVMDIEEAKKTGAMALFGEKYGEKVRVVSMGDFSKEFCGGTHVDNTSEIQAFKILSESGIAAGVRRIEALTGPAVFAYYEKVENELAAVAKELKSTPDEALSKVKHLNAELKEANSQIEALKAKAAQASLGDVSSEAEEVNGIKILVRKLENTDMNAMRSLSDSLKEKLGEAVIVFATANGGKVSLMAAATDGAVKKGAHAGNIVKAAAKIAGGGGGGRPNMAQAGGRDASKIEEALKEAGKVAREQING